MSSMETISTIPRDYRPGRQAGRELEIRSPLIEAELNKGEIRELSRRLGLADVGSAGIGMPLVAYSLWFRGHRCRNSA